MKPGLPTEMASSAPLPKTVLGYVSVRAAKSVFGTPLPKGRFSSAPYRAKSADRREVRRVVEKSGLTVLAESALGVAVAGPPAAYEELTGATLVTRERLMQAEFGRSRYVTHIDLVGPKQPRTLGVGVARARNSRIDGVVLERPRIPQGVFPSPLPPDPGRFHLRVPDDVALGLGANAAHRAGRQGDGIVVAMPDSGHYPHPFFAARHYALQPVVAMVPGTDPQKDPVGHGTGESANLFALAPGATLQPVRISDDGGRLVAAIGGFLKAKERGAAIITCSWGGDTEYPPAGGPDDADRAFAVEIQDAVESGVVVVFSAGNGSFSIEPQVPGVIAAGGAYVNQGLDVVASDYASGYESPWFPDVVVPTVCGLVGLRPRAQYILLPVPPGSQIDDLESKPALPEDPATDGTSGNDGWALFSGTSAAAPQIAGAVALVLGAKPGLTPAQVTEALTKTAIDVTSGRCFPRFNNPAGVGRDAATGYGLVDASAAVEYARTNF